MVSYYIYGRQNIKLPRSSLSYRRTVKIGKMIPLTQYFVDLTLKNSWADCTSACCILPACTTATAHIHTFAFDLVMDFMAIFSNKQAEVSTDTRVYKVWKHVTRSKHFSMTVMWNIQLDDCPLHDILLITIQTKINNCHPLPYGGWGNHNRKPTYTGCQCTALFCH